MVDGSSDVNTIKRAVSSPGAPQQIRSDTDTALGLPASSAPPVANQYPANVPSDPSLEIPASSAPPVANQYPANVPSDPSLGLPASSALPPPPSPGQVMPQSPADGAQFGSAATGSANVVPQYAAPPAQMNAQNIPEVPSSLHDSHSPPMMQPPVATAPAPLSDLPPAGQPPAQGYAQGYDQSYAEPAEGYDETYAAPNDGYDAVGNPAEGSYADQGYDSYGSGGVSADTISEIAEGIVEEKLAKLMDRLESTQDLKSSSETSIAHLSDRLKRIEKIIDRLQLSILQKVGEYSADVSHLKKELIETQKTFKAHSRTPVKKK